MAGLDPAIHAFGLEIATGLNVDARDKPGQELSDGKFGENTFAGIAL